MIHQAHHYAHLIKRWKAVARIAGVRLIPFVRSGEFQLFFLKTRVLAPGTGVYISAGIHGDEPGSTEGFITWAERHAHELARLPLLLFPCLNPWGLTQNMRVDESGLDLNRCFDRTDVPVTNAIREVLGQQQFTASLTLHEDYDAQGIYLYEVRGNRPFWGEALLDAARHIIPIDGRTRIDLGRPRNGIMRRRFDPERHAKLGGLPEAVYLQRHHSPRSITFETPSEYGLDQRVKAQMAVIQACIQQALLLERANG